MRRSFLLLADAPISASANCAVGHSRQRHRLTREINASTLLATCKEG